VIFGQNFERITFGSFLHADSKQVIRFFFSYEEDPQKIHSNFWEKNFIF